MPKESRTGRGEADEREEVVRTRDEERSRTGSTDGGEAHRPAIEPEEGVELHVGEDPGGVPDP